METKKCPHAAVPAIVALAALAVAGCESESEKIMAEIKASSDEIAGLLNKVTKEINDGKHPVEIFPNGDDEKVVDTDRSKKGDRRDFQDTCFRLWYIPGEKMTAYRGCRGDIPRQFMGVYTINGSKLEKLKLFGDIVSCRDKNWCSVYGKYGSGSMDFGRVYEEIDPMVAAFRAAFEAAERRAAQMPQKARTGKRGQ